MEKLSAKVLLECELFSRTERRVVWRREAWGTSSKVLEGLLWIGYGQSLRAQPWSVDRTSRMEQVGQLIRSLDARGPAAFLTAVRQVIEGVPVVD
jgi:hypothetical protein